VRRGGKTQGVQEMNSDIKVSIITPVFNEEQNISRMLRNLHDIIHQNRHWNCEVILIEDGSTDSTREVLQREIQKYSETQLILHERNQGYTRSLKDGIAASRGNCLMYVGADEEFDCSELPNFITPLLKNETDVVLGVRWQRNAYQLFRFFLSVIYIFMLNYLFKLRVNDYNWSQGWKKELLERMDLSSKSLFVLPEIIIKAHDLKYRIKEVPSNHRGRQAGKSSVNMRIMGSALLEAFAFWRYRRSSKYVAGKVPVSPSYAPHL
jgi:glycosyltransferase involved in cell wall biosynthesis